MGWGGAFTDAVGFNLRNLSQQLSDRLMESYYGPTGLQYNMGRVPIGGADFSSRAYSYDDSIEPDYELNRWALADEDSQFKIPFILQAIRLAKQTETDLKLFASPWSPPKWMKTNNNFIAGRLIDDDKVYKSYTEYLMKFYEAYESKGIKFWGATVQNEPIWAFMPNQTINGLQFSNEQMSKFIINYLGPALNKRGMTKENFKLMVGDDNLGFVNYQVPVLLSNPEIQKYVTGFAYHWYKSGNMISYDALTYVYETVKDHIEFMIMTEACNPRLNFNQKSVDLGSWQRGEEYAWDIIEDLNRETNAWIDWNLALNITGGPNWANNFVDSPILVDGGKNEFYKQPMYYTLAHFTRLFRPGSVRVELEQQQQHEDDECCNRLFAVAVHIKSTGHLVVNILNKSKKRQTIDLLILGGSSTANTTTTTTTTMQQKLKPFVVEGKSMNSVVLKL